MSRREKAMTEQLRRFFAKRDSAWFRSAARFLVREIREERKL